MFKGLVLLSDAAKFQDLSDEFGEYNFIITDRRELQEDWIYQLLVEFFLFLFNFLFTTYSFLVRKGILYTLSVHKKMLIVLIGIMPI